MASLDLALGNCSDSLGSCLATARLLVTFCCAESCVYRRHACLVRKPTEPTKHLLASDSSAAERVDAAALLRWHTQALEFK
jgi:hypothetical protein